MKQLFFGICLSLGVFSSSIVKADLKPNNIQFEGAPVYGTSSKVSVSSHILDNAGFPYREFTVNLNVFFPNDPLEHVVTGYTFENSNSHEVVLFALGSVGDADSISEASVEYKFVSDRLKKTKIYLLEGSIIQPTKTFLGEY